MQTRESVRTLLAAFSIRMGRRDQRRVVDITAAGIIPARHWR